GTGSHDQDIVVGIGINDIGGAPAFVAPADGTCLVITTVEPVVTGSPAAGALVAEVSGSISVNGAPFAWDGENTLVALGSGGAWLPPVTVTSIYSVTAGQTIRFGALWSPAGDLAGHIYVRQGYT